MTSRQPGFPVFPDPIRAWSGWTPSRVAVVDRARDRRLTYAELDADIGRWVGLLRAAGVGPGHRVAVLAGNRL